MIISVGKPGELRVVQQAPCGPIDVHSQIYYYRSFQPSRIEALSYMNALIDL